MNEVEPRFLTVNNLIEDLQACPPDAEVTMMMQGFDMNVPITGMGKIRAKAEDGPDKTYVILWVAPESVEYAMKVSIEKMQKEEMPKESDIVN